MDPAGPGPDPWTRDGNLTRRKHRVGIRVITACRYDTAGRGEYTAGGKKPVATDESFLLPRAAVGRGDSNPFR